MQIIKRNGKKVELNFSKLKKVIDFAIEGSDFDPLELESVLIPQFRNEMTTKEIQRTLTQVAVEKTSIEEPNWQFVASKLLAYDLYKEAAINRKYKHFGYGSLYTLIKDLTEKGLYGKYILENYSEEEINELNSYMKPERDYLMNYIGIKTLSDRYTIRGFDNEGKSVV